MSTHHSIFSIPWDPEHVDDVLLVSSVTIERLFTDCPRR